MDVVAALDPSPMPYIVLMGFGFLVGIAGHIYRSRIAVAAGIGLVFAATLLLPLAVYVTER